MNPIHHSDEKVERSLWSGAWHGGTRHADSALIANAQPILTRHTRRTKQAIRIGFIALTDCAPVVMARELGLFEKHGVDVELTREIGWATIRDKVLYGALDAAHAPAGMMVASAAGLGGIRTECLTGIVLNLHGNAITLSQKLWDSDARDGGTLKEFVRRRGRALTLGTVYQWSSHSVLLRVWLKQSGLELGRDAEVVVVPPTQMVVHLRAGHIDGFCSGEPWNSFAVMSRAGWVAARSAELAPKHPEKVLMVRSDFAARADAQHVAVIAALIESARYCDDPANLDRVAGVLGQPLNVGAGSEVLSRSMRAIFDYGNGRIEPCAGFNIFSGGNANEPDARKAAWVAQSFVTSGLATSSQIPRNIGAKCFRADIFARALVLTKPASMQTAA